jgi:hypothetical protein
VRKARQVGCGAGAGAGGRCGTTGDGGVEAVGKLLSGEAGVDEAGIEAVTGAGGI